MRYDYECQNEDCGLIFEVEQGVKDKRLRKCPFCEKKTLERIILEAPMFFIEQEASTVGQLAERNTKKMGKVERQEKREAHRVREEQARERSRQELMQKLPPGARLAEKNREKPWYGKLPENVKDTTKYIMTGKTT